MKIKKTDERLLKKNDSQTFKKINNEQMIKDVIKTNWHLIKT